MQIEEPLFLVNPYNDPIVVKIVGKASFQNSGPVKALFDKLVIQGKRDFVIDFQSCTGMDSTFLGILAGLGIKLMKKETKGSVVLSRLGTRNYELVKNLGLHRILVVDDGTITTEAISSGAMEKIGTENKRTEIENARLVLEAHENLVQIDASNQAKFQDVIAFLKNQVDED